MAGGLPLFAALGVPPANQLNKLVTPSVYKSVDEAVSSTITPHNDAELFISVAANAAYYLAVTGQYSAATAGGMRIGLAMPVGATFNNASVLSAVGASTTFQIAGAGGVITNLVPASTGVAVPFMLVGTLVTAAASGTVNFQWAQSASNATGTTVKAFTNMLAIRIG